VISQSSLPNPQYNGSSIASGPQSGEFLHGLHPIRRFAPAAPDIGFAPDSGRSDAYG
jgi:hypothetical protein